MFRAYVRSVVVKDRIILELESSTEHFQFNTSMIEEIESSREEIFNLEESISTIERLTPDCEIGRAHV